MNLKKRLTITFITIIFLPVILTVVAFLFIGIFLSYNSDSEEGFYPIKYSFSSDSISSFTELTDETFYELQAQLSIDPARFADKDYLNQINEELKDSSSYIIVRKDKAIYYVGDGHTAKLLFDNLPKYGFCNAKSDAGYYFKDLRKLVKQIDFNFSTGEQGSLFIVTKINSVVSWHLVIDLFVAIIFILILTSVMLTRWINKGVFYPIRQLNEAMQSIAKGNFDCDLQNDND